MSPKGTSECHSQPRLEVDPYLEKNWAKQLQNPEAGRQFVRMLGQLNIFRGSSENFRKELCKHLVPRTSKSGEVIWREDDTGDWLAILMSGMLEMRVTSRANSAWERHLSTVRLGVVRPGSAAGDIGLLGVSEHRQSTLVTMADSVMLILTREGFEAAIASTSEELDVMDECVPMLGWAAHPAEIGALRCFRSHSPELVKEIATRLEMRLCYVDEEIIRDKDYGNEMFILQVGEVDVEANGRLLRTLSGKHVFGEMAVLGSEKRRTATITCRTLCLLFVLHGEVFDQVVSHHPAALREFNHLYIARLVSFELPKIRHEISSMNKFYGNAHPMATEHPSESQGLLQSKGSSQTDQAGAEDRPNTSPAAAGYLQNGGRRVSKTKSKGSSTKDRKRASLVDCRGENVVPSDDPESVLPQVIPESSPHANKTGVLRTGSADAQQTVKRKSSLWDDVEEEQSFGLDNHYLPRQSAHARASISKQPSAPRSTKQGNNMQNPIDAQSK